MFRINSQPAPQPASAVGNTTAQPAAPAPNSLQALLASLEQAIQRLMQQQGGQHAGGGDRLEQPVRGHPLGQRPAPTTPPSTGPFQTQPAPPRTGTNPTNPEPLPVRTLPPWASLPINKGPVVYDPGTGPVMQLPNGKDLPAQACGAEAPGIQQKGLAGGTVGT